VKVGSKQIVVKHCVGWKHLVHPNLIVSGWVSKESCKHMTKLFQTSDRLYIGSSDVTDVVFFVFKETVIDDSRNQRPHRKIGCWILI
jgi:hypothetical protein